MALRVPGASPVGEKAGKLDLIRMKTSAQSPLPDSKKTSRSWWRTRAGPAP